VTLDNSKVKKQGAGEQEEARKGRKGKVEQKESFCISREGQNQMKMKRQEGDGGESNRKEPASRSHINIRKM
jgi:hypothetical protein